MIKYIHSEEVHNLTAPGIVVPIIKKLFEPASVLDVGCGIGTWLRAFVDHGVVDYHGVDGDYVNKELLLKYLNLKCFTAHDLAKPFDLGRKFELVVSLEVAEHLPIESAEKFIDSLTTHSENILFSAAIPGQGGQNHLNEQWPSFWIEKFKNRGYAVYDPIRPLIWNNKQVDFWYRQNVFFYSKRKWPFQTPRITDIVHPECYEYSNKRIHNFEQRVERIRNGKAGVYFGLRILINSIRGLYIRSAE